VYVKCNIVKTFSFQANTGAVLCIFFNVNIWEGWGWGVGGYICALKGYERSCKYTKAGVDRSNFTA